MRIRPSEQVYRSAGSHDRAGHRHRIIDAAHSTATPAACVGVSSGRAPGPAADSAPLGRPVHPHGRHATAGWLSYAIGQAAEQAPAAALAAAAYERADAMAGLAIVPVLPGASLTV